jgi:hypothetical protein
MNEWMLRPLFTSWYGCHTLLSLSEKTSSAHMQGKKFNLKQAMKLKKGSRDLLFL